MIDYALSRGADHTVAGLLSTLTACVADATGHAAMAGPRLATTDRSIQG